MQTTLQTQFMHRWWALEDDDTEDDVVAQSEGRILVADDDDDMRELLREALVEEGYEVVTATDGREVVDRILGSASKQPVDLIVMDYRMPNTSGLEALEVIRRTYWSVPIVLISAFADHDFIVEARQMGARAILPKPFEVASLLGVISEVVHG